MRLKTTSFLCQCSYRTLAEGKYKGRIYIAANHSYGDPKPDLRDYQTHGYYTDEYGATFHLSENCSFRRLQ